MKIQNFTILAVFFSAFLLFGCATNSTRTDARAELRPDIQTPEGETFAFSLKAKGVQICECQARKDNTNHFEWAQKAPEADLFDSHGQKVGKHFKGPTWESSDGSSVMGKRSVPMTRIPIRFPGFCCE